MNSQQSTVNSGSNPVSDAPYVGPRSFKTGEKLYARGRETLELMDLLIAERIVLLYSPSGAGKTSLLQAALIPRLAGKGMNAFVPMRINLAPRPELAALDRYTASALLSLEEPLAPEQRMPLDQLATLSFSAYLEARMATNPARQVLIFDQFEEILTVDPLDVAGKEAFFAQVGEALGNRKRWACFAMREDYVAGLDPYLRPIPTRLNSRFRLDLLGPEGACEAIQSPARDAGVKFEDAAADKLVNDLRRVQVQRPDGTTENKLGLYIEPVQLQVVCLRLWEHLGPEDRTISEADVTGVGDVNSALADYYASRIKLIARETNERERTIREWFDRQLITEQGLRSQVLLQPERSEGLGNTAIRMFVDAHLVRAEERRGMTWFELSHDRLLEPIRANNAEWFAANLSPLQRQADLWKTHGREAGLLMHGKALVEAEQWANVHQAELTPEEQDFVKECKTARALVDRERQAKQSHRIAGAAVAFSLLQLIVIFFALFQWYSAQDSAQTARDAEARAIGEANSAATSQAQAITQRNAAEKAQNLATAREWAVNALGQLPADPERAVLLALESVRLAWTAEGEDALRQGLIALKTRAVLSEHTAIVLSLHYSPDGLRIVTTSADKTARVWDAESGQPVSVLRGHTDYVYDAQFSTDGVYVVTGSDDKTARMWETSTGRLVSELRGHTARVGSVAFNPAFNPDLPRRIVGTASNDGTARIWEGLNGQPVMELRGHTAGVNRITFSPNGAYVVTASEDKTARVWDWTTGKNISVLRGHTGSVYSAEFSPDGRSVVTASEDGTARVWDALTGRMIVELKGHTARVSTATFSRDGKRILTASDDKTARLWDVVTGRDAVVFKGHSDVVTSALFSFDGEMVATASYDKTVRVWRTKMGVEITTLRGHTDRVTSVALSPNSLELATGSADATVRIWDPVGGRELGILTAESSLSRASYSPDGKQILTVALDNIELWDASTLRGIRQFLGHSDNVFDGVYSPDGKRIATASADGTAVIWDVATGRILMRLTGHTDQVTSVMFSPDGTRVVTSGQDKTARVWDAATGRALLKLEGHTDAVWGAAYSPDGKLIVTASADRMARLWDAQTGALVRSLVGHIEGVNDAYFSPDAKTVVTAGREGIARVWDVATGRMLLELKGHTDSVASVRYSPDGKQILTSSADKTARIWDATTGAELTVLRGNSESLSGAAYSPDGRVVVTAAIDRTARLYVTQLNDLIQLAHQRVSRTLTPEERAKYLHETVAVSAGTPTVASARPTIPATHPTTPPPIAETPSPASAGTRPATTPQVVASPLPPTPAPSGTNCRLDVTALFRVGLSTADRARLGCPTTAGVGISVAWMAFDKGQMVWRGDKQFIYVLYDNSTLDIWPDTWNERDQYSICSPQVPTGKYMPVRGFGKVWCQQNLQSKLGWGTQLEQGYFAEVQDFLNGFAFLGPAPENRLYVLFTTPGRWQ